MGIEQSNGYCPTCDAQVLLTRSGVNHVLHFLVTIFTCGPWLFVWILLAAFGHQPWRCAKCGTPMGGETDSGFAGVVWFGIVGVFLATAAIGYLFYLAAR